MSLRNWFRLFCVLCVSVAFAQAQSTERHPRKYTPPPPTAHVEVTVVKAWNGRPILNAAVVFRPSSKDGKDQGSMELKTNEDGKAEMDLIPIGSKLRLQVIANGFQTYGDDYTVDSATKSIVIKLQKPTKLYSIYEQNGTAASQSDKKAAPDGSVPNAAGQAAPDAKPMPPNQNAAPATENPAPPAAAEKPAPPNQ